MNERVTLYSSTLYSLANEEGCTREVYDSLKAVEKLLEENGEYIQIVNSASLALSVREELLEEAFGGKLNVYVLNFMKLLAKKRMFEMFMKVVKEYEKKYFEDNNIERATIVTAFELNEAKKKAVVAKIAESVKKEIIPVFTVKPDIIGGIVIETENSSIDASVSGRLRSIERFISKN